MRDETYEAILSLPLDDPRRVPLLVLMGKADMVYARHSVLTHQDAVDMMAAVRSLAAPAEGGEDAAEEEV